MRTAGGLATAVFSQDLGAVVVGRAPIVVGGHVFSNLGDEVLSLARP